MELRTIRLAMELIDARASEESSGTAILVQSGERLLDSFNDVVDNLKGFFNHISPVAFLPNTYKTVDKVLHNLNYAAVNNVGLPVPEGFKGDMVGYSNYLADSVAVCAFVNVLLDDTYRHVSVCLTNPSSPQETLLPDLQKNANVDIEKTKKDAAVFLDPNSSNATIPYGKLIRRNADWSLVVRGTDTLKTDLARLNKKAILEKAKNLDIAIGKLIKQRKNKPEFIIDTAWLKYIANNTYLIAVYLEFSAVTYYRCLSYFNSVDGISKKLIEMAGK